MIEVIQKYLIKRMDKEKLEQHLVNNFEKMSYRLKELFILKYANLVLEEYGIENYKIEIRDLKDNSKNGFCIPKNNDVNSETIVFNKYHVENDKFFEIICIIYHEYKHAQQNNFLEASKDNNLYLNEYAKKLDYCKNKTNIDVNFCSLNFKDVSLHIKTNKNFSFLTNLLTIKDIFYHLNISEREAFLEEKRCHILQDKYKNSGIYEYDIQQDIVDFNNIYRCNLKNEEVFDIIDICYENLIEGKLPPHNKEGNLIATVMYDMCLVSGYNSGQLSEKEVLKFSSFEQKQRNLMKEGFLIYGILSNKNIISQDEKNQIISNPKLLKNLSKLEQNSDYIFIWNVISTNKDKNVDYFNKLLKDKDTFFKQIVNDCVAREICYSTLTQIFGEEFTRYFDKEKEEHKDDYIE